MRAVIQLNDYDPECTVNEDGPDDPHADTRSVVNGIETEWYRGSGNIHVTDDEVIQAAETVAGDVIIEHPGLPNPRGIHTVENAELVTVYQDE